LLTSASEIDKTNNNSPFKDRNEGAFNPVAAHGSLAGLLFRSFSLNDFPAGIGAAGRANVVGQLGVVALRAVDYAGTA